MGSEVQRNNYRPKCKVPLLCFLPAFIFDCSEVQILNIMKKRPSLRQTQLISKILSFGNKHFVFWIYMHELILKIYEEIWKTISWRALSGECQHQSFKKKKRETLVILLMANHYEPVGCHVSAWDGSGHWACGQLTYWPLEGACFPTWLFEWVLYPFRMKKCYHATHLLPVEGRRRGNVS